MLFELAAGPSEIDSITILTTRSCDKLLSIYSQKEPIVYHTKSALLNGDPNSKQISTYKLVLVVSP